MLRECQFQFTGSSQSDMLAISCTTGLLAIVKPFANFLNDKITPESSYYQVSVRNPSVSTSSSGYLTILNRDYQRVQIFKGRNGTSALELAEFTLKSQSGSVSTIQSAYSNGKILVLLVNDTSSQYL